MLLSCLSLRSSLLFRFEIGVGRDIDSFSGGAQADLYVLLVSVNVNV